MRTIKRLTAMIMVIFSAIFCLAQISLKKPVTVCKTCQQEATAASISEAEDFNLLNLLTLKFM